MSDIVAGIYESLATRIAGLAKRVGIKEDVVICGGVAKNRGFVKIFKEVIGVKLIIPESPEILPALGAALIAQREISK
jgi:activator of 2-hydroxyglutaryl-CoA dehydratase